MALLWASCCALFSANICDLLNCSACFSAWVFASTADANCSASAVFAWFSSSASSRASASSAAWVCEMVCARIVSSAAFAAVCSAFDLARISEFNFSLNWS
jgi:hypothetical protein